LTKENTVAIILSVNKAGQNFVLTYGVSSVMGQYIGAFPFGKACDLVLMRGWRILSALFVSLKRILEVLTN